MKNSENHFKFIFWYIVGLTFLVFLYTFLITFLHIPKENIRFADTAEGFLLGTGLGSGIGYLIGGSFNLSNKKTETPSKTETVTITAETSNPINDTTNAGS